MTENPSRMKVLGFAGSLREASYNRALVRAATELTPPGMEIFEFDLGEIPLFNQDVEAEGYPDAVTAFHKAIADSDALLIATPEYQHGISGVLKNAIDWASRPPRKAAILGKPVAIMGATTGMWGTARAQTQLRQVLVYNNCPMVLKPEVLVTSAKERFDEDGILIHDATRRFIGELLENLAELVRRTSS